MSSTCPSPCPSASSSTFRLYYPPGMLGRAEPIRLLLLDLGLSWEEPWQSNPTCHSIEGCLQELERMRIHLPQPVYGMPILEHITHSCTGGERREGTEQKTERGQGGDAFYLGQTPVICHYLASIAGGGRLLPKGGVREGHRACQLAADVEDATMEGYLAFNLLKKAKGYVSETAMKEEQEKSKKWWIDQRLPKWAHHFEKALTTAGHPLQTTVICAGTRGVVK